MLIFLNYAQEGVCITGKLWTNPEYNFLTLKKKIYENWFSCFVLNILFLFYLWHFSEKKTQYNNAGTFKAEGCPKIHLNYVVLAEGSGVARRKIANFEKKSDF